MKLEVNKTAKIVFTILAVLVLAYFFGYGAHALYSALN